MPYIKAPIRQEIDVFIDRLASGIIAQAQQSKDPGAFAGLLNYACTRLALQSSAGNSARCATGSSP